MSSRVRGRLAPVLAGLGGGIVQGVNRADRKLLDATGLLGFQVAMDLGWILTFGSPSNPTAQLSVVRQDASAPVIPQATVEVADVDAVHAQAVRRGVELGYPLTEEPWGVRRFLVKDPNGVILNLASHGGDAATP